MPRRVAEACQGAGRPYHVVSLVGFAGDWVSRHPCSEARLEAPGTVVQALRDADCGAVVLIGAVERPRFDLSADDPLSRHWIDRLESALPQGDDALLRTVVGLLAEEGFEIVGADALIDLRSQVGVLGAVAPSASAEADAVRAESILAALAPLDVGQACVVAEGRVLGIETVQGTDALLEYIADTRALAQGASGGILVKRAKPGQDGRVDAPTIGIDTVEAAHRVGLLGIAVEAGAVQIVDRDAVIAAADRCGLFLWARP